MTVSSPYYYFSVYQGETSGLDLLICILRTEGQINTVIDHENNHNYY